MVKLKYHRAWRAAALHSSASGPSFGSRFKKERNCAADRLARACSFNKSSATSHKRTKSADVFATSRAARKRTGPRKYCNSLFKKATRSAFSVLKGFADNA